MAKKDKLQPLQVFQYLPGTNCKKCGFLTCFAFAFALIGREKRPEDCPDLLTEQYRAALDFLNGYFGGDSSVEKTGLLIEEEKCCGCGDCVAVCDKCQGTVMFGSGIVIPRNVPPVLKVLDGRVRVIKWESCKRCMDPPEYCRVCEERCPFGALELVR